MSFYSLLMIGVIVFPLILSFDKKVHFYTHWKAVFASLVIVGSVYVFWDVLVTAAGHWGFSKKYTFEYRLWGLPLEEISFFIAVPYACLFTYQVIREYFKEKNFSLPSWGITLLTGVTGVLGILFSQGGYSRLTLVSVVVFVTLTEILHPVLFRERSFWVTTLICFVLFFLINSLLTGFPVVIYNSQEIWNIRIGTIPLEDFFYQFAYIGGSVLVYRLFDDGIFRRKS